MPLSVLLIEDDPEIGELLRLNIASEVDDVTVEPNGTRGLLLAQRRSWNLLVIDWLLHGTDGVSICQRIRATNPHVPIIMLTARSAENDRVAGLDSGADDYITKPFSIAELLARVRAQLRRAGEASGRSPVAGAGQSVVTAGELTIDAVARTASLASEPLLLAKREFDLLNFLARNPGRAFTRQQLLSAVWGSGFEGYEHTVNSHINRLRAKLEPDPAQPKLIVTVWGTGYRFNTEGLALGSDA